jgi:hypothetical protein
MATTTSTEIMMTRRITSSPVRLRSRSLHLIVSLISYGIDGNELV